MPTLDLLRSLNAAFKTDFTYNVRYEEGTQSPTETLEKRTGTCRDYALLFMEAVRSLGFGARFITGYLYDPALDGGDAMQGAGATHAWADVYLPGAGWVEYDPTNGIIAGENLIRVAVTRDPSQALPISGSFTAKPSDFLGMTVEVTVSARNPEPPEQADAPIADDRKIRPAERRPTLTGQRPAAAAAPPTTIRTSAETQSAGAQSQYQVQTQYHVQRSQTRRRRTKVSKRKTNKPGRRRNAALMAGAATRPGIRGISSTFIFMPLAMMMSPGF